MWQQGFYFHLKHIISIKVCYYYSKRRLVDLVRLLVQHKIDKKVKTTEGETARSLLLSRFKEEEIKDVLQVLDS